MFLGEKGDSRAGMGKIQDEPVLSCVIYIARNSKIYRDMSKHMETGLKGLPLAKSRTIWRLK